MPKVTIIILFQNPQQPVQQQPPQMMQNQGAPSQQVRWQIKY